MSHRKETAPNRSYYNEHPVNMSYPWTPPASSRSASAASIRSYTSSRSASSSISTSTRASTRSVFSTDPYCEKPTPMPRQLGPEYVSLSSLTPGRDVVNINVRGIISEVIYKPFRVTESDKVYMTSFKLMDNVTRVEKRAMLFAPELNMLPLVRPKDYVLIRQATYDCNTKWGDVVCALGGQGGLWMAVPQEFMDHPAHEGVPPGPPFH